MSNYYPESKVEISGFAARYYDILINIVTLGRYSPFIEKVIRLMEIKPDHKILDLGAGTGRNACLMLKQLSKKGKLIGLDISEDMIARFKKNCAGFLNAEIINKRIDRDLGYRMYFDKAFISFALHGFPQKVRKQIIRNTCRALKKNGEFFILDYNKFSLKEMSFYLKIPFKLIECSYAFSFIKKDWKKILAEEGFGQFEEYTFFRKYIRLLKAKKIS
jgi:demethylmenaquinone methyltransferase/2-methoxy-6-polyprenyl-1,4-benzoquinol methylase